MADWVTYYMSLICCQCWEPTSPYSIASDKDTISCYKTISSIHSMVMEKRQQQPAVGNSSPGSESEVVLRNQTTQKNGETDISDSGVATSSQSIMDLGRLQPYKPRQALLHSDSEVPCHIQQLQKSGGETDLSDGGMTPGPPVIYIEEACGEPRGQQLVVDFTKKQGNGEVEIRNQEYEVESGQESGSQDLTSESEPEPVMAGGQGDYIIRQQHQLQREYLNQISPAQSSETEDSRDHFRTVDIRADCVTKKEEIIEEVNLYHVTPATSTVFTTLKITKVTSTWDFCNSDTLRLPVSAESADGPAQSSSMLSCILTPLDHDKALVNVTSTQTLQTKSQNTKTPIHLVTFVESYELIVMEGEGEQIFSTGLSLMTSRAMDTKNNFPAIHTTRKTEKGTD